MGFLLPKPRPKLLDKRDDAKALRKVDAEERAKCRARSGGGCEVRTHHSNNWRYITEPIVVRCNRRATENHHLLGGIGRKNKGKSILAAHRLDVCSECHRLITNHVLVPCVPQDKAERADSVRYERRK